jgi:hypothetical protein
LRQGYQEYVVEQKKKSEADPHGEQQHPQYAGPLFLTKAEEPEEKHQEKKAGEKEAEV